MFQRRRRRTVGSPTAVIEGAESLLGGQAIRMLRASGNRVPGWARINVLAHANTEELQQLTEERWDVNPSGWDATLRYLATELLAGDKDPGALLRLQRQVLVPMELELLSGELAEPKTPAELAALITGALAHRPTWREL